MATISAKKTNKNFPLALIAIRADCRRARVINWSDASVEAMPGGDDLRPRSTFEGSPACFPVGNLRSCLSFAKAGRRLSLGATERRGTAGWSPSSKLSIRSIIGGCDILISTLEDLVRLPHKEIDAVRLDFFGLRPYTIQACLFSPRGVMSDRRSRRDYESNSMPGNIHPICGFGFVAAFCICLLTNEDSQPGGILRGTRLGHGPGRKENRSGDIYVAVCSLFSHCALLPSPLGVLECKLQRKLKHTRRSQTKHSRTQANP